MSKTIFKSEYLHGIFQYIEDNLSADLDTWQLANIGYASHAKLYRGFYDLTGHSVKEYVRKRRLSNALALIKTSSLGLTDIAYQCGYSSHQSLCRAVKSTLNVTPSEYKDGDIYYFFPPFNGTPLQSVTVSNETIPQTVCLQFTHSHLLNIENTAIDALLQAFPDYEGRIFGRNGKKETNNFCYEIYLTDLVKDYAKLSQFGFQVSHGMSSYSTLFAISTVTNEERMINAAWNYLYTEWLQSSMFEYTDEPYYEEYILKNGKPAKLKLYLPIRKRSEETKITLINNPRLHFIVARAKGYNAEHIASQTVVEYLTAQYPYIAKASKELYVRKESNAYVCGVRIDTALPTVDNENIACISTDHRNYLVLESSVMGDYDRYVDMLLSFAQDNGMDADKDGIFAVYDAEQSFDNLSVRMYCPYNRRS